MERPVYCDGTLVLMSTRASNQPCLPVTLYVYLHCHRPFNRRVLALHELWLDCRGVDALVVKELLHLLGNLHVLRQVEAADVRRGDNAIPSELWKKPFSASSFYHTVKTGYKVAFSPTGKLQGDTSGGEPGLG